MTEQEFRNFFALGLCVNGLVGAKQKEPVAYLYNGVRLPKLPEYDKSVYFGIVIYYDHNAETYGLYLDNYKTYEYIFFSESDKENFRVSDGSERNYYGLDADKKEWVLRRKNTGMPDPFDTVFLSNGVRYGTLIWTNIDVINPANGSVFLAATDPVPVYE